MKKNIIDNKKMKYYLLKAFIINLFILSEIVLSKNIIQEYHDDLSNKIKEIIQFEENKSGLERERQQLDSEINEIRSSENLGWFSKRKLVKYTERKAEITQKIIGIYDNLLKSQAGAQKIFSRYFTVLSYKIDSTISVLEITTDSTQRMESLLYLLELKTHRDWLMDTQKYYTLHAQNIISDSDRLLSYFKDPVKKKLLQEDLGKIVENKINQIDLVISAAREEELLRKRLSQFSTEMAAISGETRVYSSHSFESSKSGDRSTELSAFGENDWGDIDYENYIGLSNNEAFIQSEITPIYSQTGYLFLLQDIRSKDIKSYVAHLDSIRASYIILLDEIKEAD